MSDPIPMINGTTQGDLHYGLLFVLQCLIEVAMSDDELSPGCVDNSMMLTTGDSLDQCHAKLKDMRKHE
jgi:hypothetical protein